jgi:deoxycytidylate deaminase
MTTLAVAPVPAVLTAAMRVAGRSELKRFHTGAALMNRHGDLIATGWSHRCEPRLVRYRSMHAEHHAIRRAARSVDGGTAAVATISARGNWTMSLPCDECRSILEQAGIATVYYTTPGGWAILQL